MTRGSAKYRTCCMWRNFVAHLQNYDCAKYLANLCQLSRALTMRPSKRGPAGYCEHALKRQHRQAAIAKTFGIGAGDKQPEVIVGEIADDFGLVG